MPKSTNPSNLFPQRLRAARELRELNQGQLAPSHEASGLGGFSFRDGRSQAVLR